LGKTEHAIRRRRQREKKKKEGAEVFAAGEGRSQEKEDYRGRNGKTGANSRKTSPQNRVKRDPTTGRHKRVQKKKDKKKKTKREITRRENPDQILNDMLEKGRSGRRKRKKGSHGEELGLKRNDTTS